MDKIFSHDFNHDMKRAPCWTTLPKHGSNPGEPSGRPGCQVSMGDCWPKRRKTSGKTTRLGKNHQEMIVSTREVEVLTCKIGGLKRTRENVALIWDFTNKTYSGFNQQHMVKQPTHIRLMSNKLGVSTSKSWVKTDNANCGFASKHIGLQPAKAG